MAEPPAAIPDTATLEAELGRLLRACGAATGDVRIALREGNISRSTVPCEWVTCRDARGTTFPLFCKFGAAEEPAGPNHRLGVAYEGSVHEHVLRHFDVGLPRYYGQFTDAASGAVGIVFARLENIEALIHWPDPVDALERAALWLARFQAGQDTATNERFAPYLARYDEAYYRTWARRTLEYSRPLHVSYPWLPRLCRGAEEFLGQLATGPLVVLHGECYATNWLVGAERVVPIDWESAALAAGEIDLASVCWGWSDEETGPCVAAYERQRWPTGAPAEFARRLVAARLYLALRWLGDCPEWTTASDPPVSFDELRQVGDEAGLL